MNDRPELSPEWWDDWDTQWKWVAKDREGTWCVYGKKPHLVSYGWMPSLKGGAVYMPIDQGWLGPLRSLDVHWRYSLYRRPKKKKKALCQFSATLNGLVNGQAFSQANCYCQLEEGHKGDHHVLVRNSFGVNCVVAMPDDEPERRLG